MIRTVLESTCCIQ